MVRKLRPRTNSRRTVRRAAPSTRNKVRGIARFNPKNVWAYLTSRQGLRMLAIVTGVVLAMIVGIFLWFAKDLPSPNKINARVSAQTTKLYDRTGQHVLVEIYGDKNRSLIEFNQMPQYVKDATVAVEDKDFYKHGAFSIFGLARAFSGIVFRDPTRGGGSTITQQYVKNALLTGERSYARKIKELILSIEIEQLYKKDDILKLYLNEIPYGSTAYGIQAAAKTYFNKDAKDLTLSQSAMLAAMPQAPSYYSPYGQHTDALIARQHKVLDKMAEQRFITTDQATEAKKDNVLAQLVPYRPYANITAPHFVQYVRELLEDKYGVKQTNEGGLKVITSIDVDKQKLAEDAVSKNMSSIRKFGGSNAALVSADPASGEVMAMVGSYNYGDEKFGTFNVAVADRQPGSSFKPITYATLFKKNYGAGTTLYDVTTDFGAGYKPKNYTNRTYGVQSVRSSLASSLNIPAVKSLYMAGVPEALGTAKDLGITTLNRSADNYGLSLTLGSGEVKLTEMVNAYSAFATGGQHRKPVYVLKVTDPTGKVLEENKPENNRPKQAIDPQIAYIISNILSDNNARSSLGIFPRNNPLTLGNRPVAAKTGTTEDYKDAWTMGYTTRVVTGVWAGNNNNTPMTQSASIVSAPIWHDYMAEVTKNDPIEQFKRPAGIKEVTIDAQTGHAATNATKQKRTDIFPSWYKAPFADISQTGNIDKVSKKLATDCTPPDAIETVTSGAMHAEIPASDPAYKRWEPPVAALANSLGYGSGGALPTEKDDVHSCSDSKPSVALNVTPSSGTVFTLTASISAGKFSPTSITFLMDGNEISNQNIDTSGNISITNTPPAGSHTYSARVIDSGYYSATSNSQVITATASASPTVSMSCAAGACSVSASTGDSTIKSIEVFYNNISQGKRTSGNLATTYWGGWNNSWVARAIATDSNGAQGVANFP